jgi:ribonuclease P protein component
MKGVFMKKYETIKSKQEFSNIIHNGKFKKNSYFIIYYQQAIKSYSRYGIAINTKIGHAVIRNKLKRQVRTFVETNKKLFSNNSDYIIMIRKACLDISYSEMNNEFVKLLEEIK